MTSLATSFRVDVRDTMAPVRAWLWCVAALIFAMVVVGGATRLTESGLSITEWRPISGVLPPLNAADWQIEFDKYRQIPQFRKLFPDMDIAGFQAIFWWEWSHRLLGRLIGVAFALPLAWFWARGVLTRWLQPRLLGLLALGGLQGVVGWWMVASGLVNRVEVAPERLTIHLVLASLTLVSCIWLASRLRANPPQAVVAPLRTVASALIVLILVQLALGALVAGARAGLVYNTWPLMDGKFVPFDQFGGLEPAWRNIFENSALVQFNHRCMAYLVVICALAQALYARRVARGGEVTRAAMGLFHLTLAQAALGVTVLLLATPLWAGLAHQAFAMIVLGFATAFRARMQ